MKIVVWNGTAAMYDDNDLALAQSLVAQAERGEISAAEAKRQLDHLHDLKTYLDATDETDNVAVPEPDHRFDSPPRGMVQAAPMDTSLQAALSLDTVVGKQRREVYEAFKRAGEHGLTDEALRDQTGIVRARTRRKELIEMHAIPIRDTGRRQRTRSGRTAAVWVLS